jgi:site-specific recombinase XerD
LNRPRILRRTERFNQRIGLFAHSIAPSIAPSFAPTSVSSAPPRIDLGIIVLKVAPSINWTLSGTDGGIGVKMRAIRALYNFAIERNLVKEEFYPFKTYKVSKLKGKSPKKALTMEQVKKIVDLDLKKYPSFTNARNYFVFSFYTRGMNFADMMKLEWKAIDDNNIFYTRSKTKGNFMIKILPPVREILDYYQEYSLGTKYVFPILLKDELTPLQLENRKHKTLQRYNKELKETAKICGIDKPLSSYVARHSYANCLKQKGVATDVISESMGHQNLAVTQAYLKELDNAVLDEASELLL